jgi:hypothetical protein
VGKFGLEIEVMAINELEMAGGDVESARCVLESLMPQQIEVHGDILRRDRDEATGRKFNQRLSFPNEAVKTLLYICSRRLAFDC